MTEILHAWALAPAAVGTCCLAAGRRRVRAPELAASVLMLVAMMDAARSEPAFPPVYWAVLLIAAAIVLAALRRSRGARRYPPSASAPGSASASASIVRAGPGVGRGGDVSGGPRLGMMTVHTTVGMVAMAALLLAMSAHPTSTVHKHGLTAGAFIGLLMAGTAVYACGSAVAAARATSWLDRTQYAAMGASTMVMGLALLG